MSSLYPVNGSYTPIFSAGNYSNGTYSGLMSDPVVNTTGGVTANYESIGGPVMRGGGQFLTAQGNGYGFSEQQGNDMSMRGISSYSPTQSGGRRRRRGGRKSTRRRRRSSHRRRRHSSRKK